MKDKNTIILWKVKTKQGMAWEKTPRIIILWSQGANGGDSEEGSSVKYAFKHFHTGLTVARSLGFQGWLLLLSELLLRNIDPPMLLTKQRMILCRKYKHQLTTLSQKENRESDCEDEEVLKVS